MVNRIGRDNARFKQIVRGKIKQELRKYMSHGEMIGKKGKDLVSIPMPRIEVPHFRYGPHGGVGQGEGEEGDSLGSPGQGKPGAGGAGDQPGGHILEVEVSLEELAQLMGEQLELPRMEPKGKGQVTEHKLKYNEIRRVGPESLRHFKRTYRQALRRQIASNQYNPRNPVVVPIREDKLYRSWTEIEKPEDNAAVIYMMDISGSMTDEEKEIVRLEAFWIDTWLRSQYNGVETRYIVHDAEAHIVDKETFYHIRESGGTRISSAYKKCDEVIDQEFPVNDWNIYPFHFSDGDNWGEDNAVAIEVLDRILEKVNLFCYGQVLSAYGSGKFLATIEGAHTPKDNLVSTEIENKEAIYDSIQVFLGTGVTRAQAARAKIAAAGAHI